MAFRKLLVLSTILAIGHSSTLHAEEPLNAELLSIEEQLKKVELVMASDATPLVRGLASARKELLLLMKTAITARKLANLKGFEEEIRLPVVLPNPETAEQILQDILESQGKLKAAIREESTARGLTKTLVSARIEAEKLKIVQLETAYYQAQYGIYIPKGEAASKSSINLSKVEEPPEGIGISVPEKVSWADPSYPEIDYSALPFKLAAEKGDTISGWWSVTTGFAEIDDSPETTAKNYSQFNPKDYGGVTALIAQCHEHQTALVFVQDKYIKRNYRTDTVKVTYRIDRKDSVVTRWSALVSNKGAGIFGRQAENFIRSIYNADKILIRLIETDGRQHTATFDLAGSKRAFDAVAASCGWSTLSLSAKDYATIQKLLNIAGFNAGKPDGKWGRGSKTAMKAFQASAGLKETGAPNRETLNALGYEQ